MKIKFVGKIIILIVIIVLITFVLVILLFKDHTYTNAKNEVEKYLDNNVEELTEIALTILKSKETQGINFKGISNLYYGVNKNNEEYVDFHVNAQGFLGGQYWGLYYMPNNKYLGEDTLYIWQETNGNNVIVCKKLRDNWFFYYIDYDGNININIIE